MPEDTTTALFFELFSGCGARDAVVRGARSGLSPSFGMFERGTRVLGIR